MLMKKILENIDGGRLFWCMGEQEEVERRRRKALPLPTADVDDDDAHLQYT